MLLKVALILAALISGGVAQQSANDAINQGLVAQDKNDWGNKFVGGLIPAGDVDCFQRDSADCPTYKNKKEDLQAQLDKSERIIKKHQKKSQELKRAKEYIEKRAKEGFIPFNYTIS